MGPVNEVDAGGLEACFSAAKKQILLTLKRRGAVSLSDISEELRISKMATLKHLNVLEAKGLVERSFKAGGRGRPRAFFNLSKSSATLFPEAYTHMTLCALNFIEEKLGRDAVVRLLQQRAQEVLDANRNRIPDSGLKDRVGELVKIRDEGGYMAEMGNARKNVVEMLEHNCPIMAVGQGVSEGVVGEAGKVFKPIYCGGRTSPRSGPADPLLPVLLPPPGLPPGLTRPN